MKTFSMKCVDSAPIDGIRYHPMKIVVAGVVHDLGLHKYAGEWVISHLSSGKRVCRVSGVYKGVVVSTKGLKVAEIKRLAPGLLDARVDAIGAEKFNRAIARAVA